MDGCAFSAAVMIGYDGGVLRLRRCVRQGRLIQSEGRVGRWWTDESRVRRAIPLLGGVAKWTPPLPSPRLVEVVSKRKPRFGESA